MKIAIVTTGDEIMSGNVVDTNSAWLADKCWMLGHEVVWHGGVADKEDTIIDACKLAGERAEVVFVSGGLGATLDDITLSAAAKGFGKKMVLREDIWNDIQAFFKKVGRECTENNKRQAYIPEGGKPLANRVGTAPGVQVKFGKAVFFFLPGVPKELYQIFNDSIFSWLKEKSAEVAYSQKFLKCFGLPEASFDERIKGISFKDIRVSFRVSFPEIKIKIVARGRDGAKKMEKAEEAIKNRIGQYIFGADEDTLPSIVGGLLKKKGLKIAVAESCTGGMISNMLTNISGASEWFERGVISYSNRSKIDVLGVKESIIKEYGAVSRECAIEMAEGIRKLASVGIGVSVTGIAGPSGGTKDKPVGTVHIALAVGKKTLNEHHIFSRDRESFKMFVAYCALDMIRKSLL